MTRGNLANVMGALVNAMEDELRADGDPIAIAALVHLSKYPGASIEDVRVTNGLTSSGCSRMIDRLVAAREVERRSGDDGRTVALYLTRRGRTAVASFHERRARSLVSSIATLADDEIEQLGALVTKLLAARVATSADGLRVCRECDYGACKQCPVADRLRGL